MNEAVLHRQLAAAKLDAKSLYDTFKAEVGSGAFTVAQKAAVDAALDRVTQAETRLKQVQGDAAMNDEIDRQTSGIGGGSRTAAGTSLGAQFWSSPTGEWTLKNRGRFPSSTFHSPASELSAATLTENAASGGDLILPQYVPGILPLPTRPLRLADLFAQGTADSNVISYMLETSFDNAADTVLEGGDKPESTLIFDAVSAPVRKIAHWLPVTEELLDDVAAMRSYLDARLRLGVDLALDFQLLNGSLVAPDIVGILNRPGLGASIARTADESNADALLSQIAAIENETNLRPDGIVMNPSNWVTIQRAKDDGGAYYGSGPFASPQAPTLWGIPVALTPVIAPGLALVGAFKTGAQLFRKGGVRVEMTNSHADYFTKNLLAVRAEVRAALACFRPAAFATVTNLD